MRTWEIATLVFFVYVALVGAMGERPRSARRKLYAGVAVGLLFLAITATAPEWPLLHDWLAPPAALLMSYWTSGFLFVAPVASQERALLSLDRRLRILDRAQRMPAFLARALEAAYVGVYPSVGLSFVLYLFLAPNPDPARFWSVVLITDYLCFGVLAWIQTRPPRAIEGVDPWDSAIRRFNLRLLGATSIQVNTFPSGHAAEALAAALLLFGAPWPVAGLMFVNALAISAGAVFGRYHYAADALAGWAVAILVWLVLR
jgi:membrane-associated phospholipid phosphatase